MSDMEHNKGKLIPFEMTEATAKLIVEAKEGTGSLDECYPTYLDQLKDDPDWYDEDLIVIKDKWYKGEFEIKRGELYGFADVIVNGDGSIDFNTWHYNGAAHWTKVIGDKLDD